MKSDKSLKEKAVNIKGKQYVQVADRILFFNENYENGCIQTELLSTPDAARVVVKATVYPHGLDSGAVRFTGHAQEVVGEGNINRTSALENAETSAVGRALAMMGIGVIESVASADELRKASKPATAPKPANVYAMTERAIEQALTPEVVDGLVEKLKASTKLTPDEKERLQFYADQRKSELAFDMPEA